MSVKLPNGSIISIASTYAAAKTVTVATNASECVMTSTTHGFSNGDILEITSGWSRLNGRLARVKSSTTDTFALEGIDTSDTSRFPAGSGIGTVRKITAWTQLSQVTEFAKQGGEQQFATYSFLEDDTERQIPTQKSAESFTMSLGDDQSLPWYAVLDAADQDRLQRGLKIALPSGAVIYADAFATMNRTPSMTKNEVMVLSATFSLVAPVTRYAS